MVHIEIYDRNFLDLLAVGAQSVARCHGDVVDKAEAIGAGLAFIIRMERLPEDARVVARRACRTERISKLTRHD